MKFKFMLQQTAAMVIESEFMFNQFEGIVDVACSIL